jgi:chemotaxis protein CheD
MAVSNEPEAEIVTHALGSCIAVCVHDPIAGVAAMLHFLLPEAKINLDRARDQPAAFADTGIPLLFQTAYSMGLDKKRAKVSLVGGAETNDAASPSFKIGKRNAMAAKSLLWKNGVMVRGEEVGGTIARTVHMHVGSGRVQIFNGRDAIGEIA